MKSKPLIFTLGAIFLFVSIGYHVARTAESKVIQEDGSVLVRVKVKRQNLEEFLVPTGTTQAFAGLPVNIPDAQMICNGTDLLVQSRTMPCKTISIVILDIQIA
jgi:hypothetical protein